ncbi:alpha/beta fold hydrolase [Virgibacillus kekensis]|uniref:Alpha/beta fold hydrolase n=1 Tax=Virgibacillus kekensis TaxID=202261 RepID=A0ABV9DQL7_9BACI
MKTTSNKRFLNIRGKDMYVEIHGDEDAYPLLYLHGGPGESCYEFCYHQAKRLQESFRLIAIDQRGVCRSEMIKNDERFSLDDILLDCEELRKELGIESWALLGHSFGGYIALKYATMFSDSVSRLIFESPTFDFGLSGRSLLRKTAQISHDENMKELAEKCLELAQSDKSAKELMLKFIEIRSELGEKGKEIHIHNPNHETDYSFYTDQEWERFYKRTTIHNNRLLEGGEMFESLLSKLKVIEQPSILIRGKYDPVTCEEQMKKFQKDVPDGEVVTLRNSGHFPHFEEPDEFTKSVVEFLK